ncbi:hypothetical protein M9458_053456 [Cirrhinus mrigala]|uniref:Uncharacterized protein n=1 Tax=Cirrhinus mrigala TaxID=683832 RepID=A0ABD0MMD7_CIRMR
MISAAFSTEPERDSLKEETPVTRALHLTPLLLHPRLKACIKACIALKQWSQTQFLEDHSSAQFSSNPNQRHLIQLIKGFRIIRNFQAGSCGPPGIEFETSALKQCKPRYTLY